MEIKLDMTDGEKKMVVDLGDRVSQMQLMLGGMMAEFDSKKTMCYRQMDELMTATNKLMIKILLGNKQDEKMVQYTKINDDGSLVLVTPDIPKAPVAIQEPPKTE